MGAVMSRAEAAINLSENSRIAYKGNVFDIVVEEVKSPQGEVIEAEFVVCDNVVRVYPFDRKGVLWLIRERRMGMGEDPILRTVSGAIEPPEKPEAAARRELLEELGMRAESFHVFHESTPMLKARYKVYHVVALGARQPANDYKSPDPLEDIEPVRVQLDRVEPLVWEGAFREDIISFALLKFMKEKESTPLVDG